MPDETGEVPTTRPGTARADADGRPRRAAERRDPVRVLLAGREMEALHEQIRAAAPRVECISVPGASEGERHLGLVDIAIVGGRVTPAYAAAPGLRWLHLTAAGVDGLAIPELRSAPYPITHKALASVAPMADHVLTYILVFARRVLELRALQQAGQWGAHGGPADTMLELRGKTVGIVGLGGVGRAVARRARPFGLRVIGVKRTPMDRLPNVDRIYPVVATFSIRCMEARQSTDLYNGCLR